MRGGPTTHVLDDALSAERGARIVPLPLPRGLPPWQDLGHTQGGVTSWDAPD